MFLCPGAPPTYLSSVGQSGMPAAMLGPQQQQQQLVAPQVSPTVDYYSGATAMATAPSVYDASDAIPPVKI